MFPASESPTPNSTCLNLLERFPVLSHISATLTSSAVSSSLTTSPGLVLALPHILLQSAKSHVLDEPVPKFSCTDTLPWDCSFASAAIFTVLGRSARYLLEPLTLKTSLAAQHEGLGVTVTSDLLALSLSKKQVRELVSNISHCVSTVKTLSL